MGGGGGKTRGKKKLLHRGQKKPKAEAKKAKSRDNQKLPKPSTTHPLGPRQRLQQASE